MTACACVHADGSSGVAGYLLRLLSYLPGTPVAEIPSSPPLLYEVGRLAGKLDETLQVGRGALLASRTCVFVELWSVSVNKPRARLPFSWCRLWAVRRARAAAMGTS